MKRDVVVGRTTAEAESFIQECGQALAMDDPVSVGGHGWRALEGLRIRHVYVLGDALWSQAAEVALRNQLHSGRAVAAPVQSRDGGDGFIVWHLVEEYDPDRPSRADLEHTVSVLKKKIGKQDQELKDKVARLELDLQRLRSEHGKCSRWKVEQEVARELVDYLIDEYRLED